MFNELQSLLWIKGKKNPFKYNEMPASFISSWDRHVISWTANKWRFPFLIIKFEDMVYKKEETIRRLVEFFVDNYGFKFDNIDNKIKNILDSTGFERLKEEESRDGFIEAQKGRTFFKSGEKKQWLKKLNKNQILKLEEKFKIIMDKFNYK